MMRKENHRAQLIGVDDRLIGNESRIIPCMPIIRISDDKLAAVRNLYWEFNGEGLRFAPREELEDNVTLFGVEQDIEISSSELVILIGPKFFNNLVNLSIDFINKYDLYEVDEGFKISIFNLDEYESFMIREVVDLSRPNLNLL